MLIRNSSVTSIVVAILVGSSTYIGVIPVVLTCFLFINIAIHRTDYILKRNIYSDISFLLFFLGGITSFFLLLVDPFTQDNSHTIILALRKNGFEFFTACIVFLYFNDKSYNHIIKILFLAFLINSTVALFQFVYGSFERVSMLFVEPSSAGYFICSFIFLVLAELKKSKNSSSTRYYIFCMSLLVASKAQFLIYSIYLLLKSKRVFSIIITIIILFSVVVFTEIHQYLVDNSNQYKGFAIMLDALKNIDESSIFNMYSTYSTRFVSIYIAVQTIINNPMGIAFGEFNFIFKSDFYTYISAIHLSDEMTFILSDSGYATPKSKILELFLSTGWFGFIVVCIYSYKYIKGTYKKNYPLCLSFIFFLTSSLLVELNNIYLYFFIFSVLIMKFKEPEQLTADNFSK